MMERNSRCKLGRLELWLLSFLTASGSGTLEHALEVDRLCNPKWSQYHEQPWGGGGFSGA